MDRIREAILEYWGPRCDPSLDDPEVICECCEVWREFDELMELKVKHGKA